MLGRALFNYHQRALPTSWLGRLFLHLFSCHSSAPALIGPVWMTSVKRRCQSASRHIPTNCGPQKLLVAIATHRPVAEACRTPYSRSSFTQSQLSNGQSPYNLLPPSTRWLSKASAHNATIPLRVRCRCSVPSSTFLDLTVRVLP